MPVRETSRARGALAAPVSRRCHDWRCVVAKDDLPDGGRASVHHGLGVHLSSHFLLAGHSSLLGKQGPDGDDQ